MKWSVVPLVCMTLWPVAAPALQPLVTDDTGTQGRGGNQVEAAYNRTLDKGPDARIVTHEVPAVFTRGVTEALDLYAQLGYRRIVPPAPETTESGWGNPAAGAKWRFYENEAAKLSFALKPEIKFPVSARNEARGLGTARTSYSAGLLMTRETGFGAVHANLAVERVRYAGDALNQAERRTLYRLSAAPVWDVAEGWKLSLDAGLTTNPDRAARVRMGYVQLGAIYSPDKDLEVALGILRNAGDGAASTTQSTIGLTWRFR